jgi:hypothetical protein
MRVTDPRQQTMLTNQMLTPVMNKPVMPSREVPVFPSVGGIGGGVVPTAEETTDSFEEYLSTLTTDDLDNLDLSGLNLGDINIPSYERNKRCFNWWFCSTYGLRRTFTTLPTTS